MTSEKGFANDRHSGFEHVTVLLTHLRLTWLLNHLPPRFVWAVYVGINGFVTIGLLALLAVVTGNPFVFPSLGPTAYLFFSRPSQRHPVLVTPSWAMPSASSAAMLPSPLTIGLGPPFTAHGGVHAPRVLAAALSLSATGALMALSRVSHPPAGATTLIVSLGIISQPKELVVIEIAVILLTAQALVINRIAGISYPLWSGHTSAATIAPVKKQCGKTGMPHSAEASTPDNSESDSKHAIG